MSPTEYAECPFDPFEPIMRPSDDVIEEYLKYANSTSPLRPLNRVMLAVRSIARQLIALAPGDTLLAGAAWDAFNDEHSAQGRGLPLIFQAAFESAWFTIKLALGTRRAPDQTINLADVPARAVPLFDQRLHVLPAGPSSTAYLTRVIGGRLLEQLRAPEVQVITLQRVRYLVLEQLRELDTTGEDSLRRLVNDHLTRIWRELKETISEVKLHP